MKDKNFEIDSEVEDAHFTFTTYSDGFTNTHFEHLNEAEFNALFDRHIKKFREWCDKYL